MLNDDKNIIKNQQSYIATILSDGKFLMGFPKDIEQQYAINVKQKILQRVPAVAISSLLFMLIFSGLDWLMMPDYLAYQTIFVRLVVVVPVILIISAWLIINPPKFYLIAYGFVFLWTCLWVVWIIWRAHSQAILLPYEGLMITIIYGFVVMGFPLWIACLLNAIVIAAYMLTEPLYDLSLPTYIQNVSFLLAMYLAGLFSAWILDYSHRKQFLQQEILNLNEIHAKLDVAQKNRYLAVASHDLRQPLQAIRLLSDEIVSDHKDPRFIKLKTAADALNSMFNQLLDVSRINLDLLDLHIRPLAIKPFLNNAISIFQPQAQAAGIIIHTTICDGWVQTDSGALQRIISNLLQNALQHSGANTIEIRTQIENDELLLSIKDDGCGILETDQSRVFDAFTRLNSDVQSLGVGLSIVKRLSQKLGHNLTLINQSGCEFQLRFMLISKPQLTESVTEQPHILLVEDDTHLLQQYQQWFIQWGWQVDVASNLRQAFALIKNKPNWILSDCHLTDGTGNDLFSKVKAQLDYKPKLLMVTGDQSQCDLHQDWDVLLKPITPSRLRAYLQNNLH